MKRFNKTSEWEKLTDASIAMGESCGGEKKLILKRALLLLFKPVLKIYEKKESVTAIKRNTRKIAQNLQFNFLKIDWIYKCAMR